MDRCRQALVIASVAIFVAPASAQEDFAFPEPTASHAWLEKFAGTWDTTSLCGAPGEQTETSGRMTAKLLGGRWMVAELSGEMPGGGSMAAVLTVGFDPDRELYVGTWVDSMLDYMWRYEGTVDGPALVLEAEGPNFMTGEGTTVFRDTYTFASPDHIVLTSAVKGDDGTWEPVLRSDMRRVE